MSGIKFTEYDTSCFGQFPQSQMSHSGQQSAAQSSLKGLSTRSADEDKKEGNGEDRREDRDIKLDEERKRSKALFSVPPNASSSSLCGARNVIS